jgi:hypothetical protein
MSAFIKSPIDGVYYNAGSFRRLYVAVKKERNEKTGRLHEAGWLVIGEWEDKDIWLAVLPT